MSERRLEYMPLGEVQRAPRNAKAHDADAIKTSIDHFGLADLPVLDDRTGRLVSGHGRLDDLQARHAAGEDPPDGIKRRKDGTWLVPVVRGWQSRSDEDAEAYLLMANQATILGGWDTELLGPVLTDLAEADLLALTGFTDDDLAELLGETEDEGQDGGGDPDDTPDTPIVAVTQPGDVWCLGPNRLVCGDATNPEHVDLALKGLGDPGIVYTDPPYGISVVGSDGKVGDRIGYQFGGVRRGSIGGSSPFGSKGAGGRSGKVIETTSYLPVAGDDTTQTAADAFALLLAAHPAAAHVWWGGNHYAASAGLPDASCWLVWDKDNTGNFADAELAWTNHPGAVRLLRHMWNGMLRASERGKRVHPTQKPVALAEWAFGVVDPDGSRRLVLDVFAGSGSTLLAAYRTGRTAALVECEAPYCDVIARRFQEATGIVPTLESTGEEHDFTAATAVGA